MSRDVQYIGMDEESEVVIMIQDWIEEMHGSDRILT